VVRSQGIAFERGAPPARPRAPPAVDAATGGTATVAGSCVEFTASPAGPAERAPAVELTLPGAGISITARGGRATVRVRRFAAGFPKAPLGWIAPGGTGTLVIREDLASQPWRVRVAPEARTTACGLPAGR
jgi:hypothetical protein